jgi:hypothetical protein
LIGQHQIEIVIGLDLKELKNLIQHLPVLGRRAGNEFQPISFSQRTYQGRHLDGFGTSPKDD